MLDSLYGNLLGSNVSGPANAAPTVQGKPPAEAGGGAAPGPAGPPPAEPPVPAAAPGKAQADDIFAEPKDAAGREAPAPAPAPQPTPAPAPAPAPQPQPQGPKNEPSGTPLPQAFSAAKLMMPPVRKKAEPVGNKRPIQSFDIQKLQEEKEALMRQRAAAEKKDDKPASSPASAASASASLGGDSARSQADESAVPASASTAPAGASANSQATSAMVSLYGNPDEEYDPAKPNDYDEFCRRRMRQKAEEEMERRRQEALARQQQASKPAEPKEDDFATRMLKKMGWKEGAGLGKEGQGMAAPLVMKKTDRATGAIVEGQKREAPGQAAGQPEAKQPKASASFNRPPTKVLLLNNLVGAGEVDEDLEGETAEEASKYGKLKRCVIKEIKGVSDDQAVRIFLEYERSEDATKALVDMNGRYFGGRVVRARFYDEARFEKGDLEKKDSLE